jgi:deazaflavin-dependent oxidoreductase (nitroreductase family)
MAFVAEYNFIRRAMTCGCKHINWLAQAETMIPAQNSNFLYLTTTGRRSGLAREIEIWYTQHVGRYFVIAEYSHSNWVQNLLVNSDVRVRVGELQFRAVARVVNAELETELHGAVRELSRKKYGWGEGLVVELVPQIDK